MLDKKTLRTLKRGVKVWNEWRARNADVPVFLEGADFSGADLRGALFNNTHLSQIDFSGTDLRGAYFNGADLTEANLANANLTGATLTFVDLRFADLNRACLAHAYFNRVILSETKLSEADFSNARMGWIIIAENDLSTVKGLETIQHHAPSTIGIDTLYRSGGNIPNAFLHNAGVPDEFITYARSLVGKPIDFYSCFISYSTKDSDFAERIYADLQSNGVRCWYAPKNLKIGDRFREQIEESIRVYDRLLIIISDHSVSSRWVEREVFAAIEREDTQNQIVLFPIRLDDSVLISQKPWAAEMRRGRHIGDFREWKNHDVYQVAFERLLHDLKAQIQT